MSATSSFLKKGSGEKYIKNRPYTANCAKRVRSFDEVKNSVKLQFNSFSDCASVLNSITSEEHKDIGAEVSKEM
jgi:hypothetical protein